jgi:glutamate-1-semialdehyde aminotransferase
MEPAMTNIGSTPPPSHPCGWILTRAGIVHPAPGYLDAVRAMTREFGTLLIIDEVGGGGGGRGGLIAQTHTICAGPGGFTKMYGLEPDIFVIGKPLGGGVPCGTYGLSEGVANAVRAHTVLDLCDTGGIGGGGGELMTRKAARWREMRCRSLRCERR